MDLLSHEKHLSKNEKFPGFVVISDPFLRFFGGLSGCFQDF
jgi:hypothetical protein